MKFLAALLCSFSLVAGSLAAPAQDAAANALDARTDSPVPVAEPHPLDKREDMSITFSAATLFRRSAGLYWGPVNIGNLRLYLTNPHNGYAGPKFPNANHVNFHVDKSAPRNSWAEVVNAHIVKYTSGSQQCLYVWDSVSGRTIFDNCFNDFGTAIQQGVVAVKSFVDTLLKNADAIASVAIIAALGIALVAALTSLGAVVLV